MLSTIQSNLIPRLTASLGNSTNWQSKTGDACHLWLAPSFEVIAPKNGARDSRLRQILEDRKHLRAATVILITESDTNDRVRVLGPQAPFVPHDLDSTSVHNVIETARNFSARQAASFLEREFRRLAESVLPGIRVKELLTPHYLRTRMRQRPRDMQRLQSATEKLGRIGPSHSWRTLFNQLGYKTEQLPKRGYLLRHDETPVAVIHPMQDAEEFSRMNENGELPDGLVLNDCLTAGANWGILASGLRFRIFQAKPAFGSATARWIEIDAREIGQNDKPYLGLLSPDSLKFGGWLTEWATDARDFGEELRKGLEERLRSIALTKLAQGIGRYLELNKGVDLKDRDNLREIEEAVLTFVFRFMFLLHVEARGYLPVQSPAYNPHSATKIGQDCLLEERELSNKSTQRWDRIRTLVRMVRNGDRSAGVPAYNGSLFAANRFPGAELLEHVEIPDTYLAPAIRAIAYDIDKSDAGIDYAGLRMGHLGAIYEALLAMRLTRANEDLKYDIKRDVFWPTRAGEVAEITASELFYHTEQGGRKSGGVYYTRGEFVQHLLKNSLVPALDEHLERIKELAQANQQIAAHEIFNFSIVDPAMGSGHFLTIALDVLADRIDLFLADIGGLPAVRDQLDELRHGQESDLATVEDVDLLRRLILKRCIYGVDIAPMAVEIANVTLWLASFVPGLALSYLGSNLKCGNSLIGVADPKAVGSNDSPFFTGQAVTAAMERAVKLQRELANVSDITPDEVKRSQKLDDEVGEATGYLQVAFNLWAADPLGLDGARHTLEMHAAEILRGNLGGPSWEAHDRIDASNDFADEYEIFHWPLEFPHIFHRDQSGFDVVVGNPPWNEITVEELNFYTLRDPGLSGLSTANERQSRVATLDLLNPDLRIEYENERKSMAVLRRYFSEDGGYQMQGVGDKDLYQLFCERYTKLLRDGGRIGVVLPRTSFLTEGAKPFRQWLFGNNTVVEVDILRNTKQWAFQITPQYRIALLAALKSPPKPEHHLKLTGPSASLKEFDAAVNKHSNKVSTRSLGSSYVLPLIPSQSFADLLTKFRTGVDFEFLDLSDYVSESRRSSMESRLVPDAELHATQQKHIFRFGPGDQRIGVWQGRSFDQYSPHGKEPAGYCVWSETLDFLQSKRMRSRKFKKMFPPSVLKDLKTLPVNSSRVVFRDVARASDTRTLMGCLIPPKTPITNKAPYFLFSNPFALDQSAVLGILNSLCLDWMARRFVETNVNFYILNMLTFPRPLNTPWQRIGKLAARLSCVDERFAEFAAESGVDYGPQPDAERDDMRAEIDALVARAYDLTEDELRFVFTDFTERAATPAYRQLVLEKFEAL